MKTLRNLLLATAILTTGAVLSAKAGEALYSPKAKEVADSLRKAPASAEAPNLAIRPVGNAKAAEVALSHRTAPGNSVDLAHASRPNIPAKDTGFETAWRENALREVQIAPMK